MKRAFSLFLGLVLISSLVRAFVTSRDDLPRTLEDPQTMRLSGGSRIEFGTFASPSLQEPSHYSVFFPPSYDELALEEGLPVVYFLHGMWNDHTSWVVERYGSVPEKLEALMLEGTIPETLIVSPDGDNSFYTDFLDGTLNFEQLVYKDLVSMVESRYKVLRERRARAIAGVSMGGYGALKIAMKFPELYSSVAAVSPIVFSGEDPSGPIMNSTSRGAQYFRTALKPVYGMPFEENHWHKNNLEVLAQESDLKGLRIYFSYGTADRYNRYFPLQKGVERLSEIFQERKIPHEFKLIQNGPHGWDLVKDRLQEVFAFVTETF